MAIGLGLMLGFVFAKNFDSPYLSGSITEFWRRWHISLSTWLRDYLYVPLGGNRKGPGRTYVNLALTMLLGGLWHGASWNFVIWGAFHGALLALERFAGVERLYGWMPRALRVAWTFTLVLVSWVFFRAADLPAALAYLGRMFGAGETAPTAPLLAGLILSPYLVLSFALAAIVTWVGVQSWNWTREIGPLKAAAVLALFVVAVTALSTQDYNPFIYFIF
jgi:alginate O-acetyltransferase complex protein AlgI